MGVLGSWGILSTIMRSNTSFSGCNDGGGMDGGGAGMPIPAGLGHKDGV